MKIFSFPREDNPKFPEQITLEINSTELRELSNFLLQCASEIEEDVEWEHEHLSDYLERVLECDIVVFNDSKNNQRKGVSKRKGVKRKGVSTLS